MLFGNVSKKRSDDVVFNSDILNWIATSFHSVFFELSNTLRILKILLKRKSASLKKIHFSLFLIRPFRLRGYVSSCEHGFGRPAADRQFIFFNNRPVDYPKVIWFLSFN